LPLTRKLTESCYGEIKQLRHRNNISQSLTQGQRMPLRREFLIACGFD
jgi:hypothetical protein